MSDKLFYVRCQGDGSWLKHAFGKGAVKGDISDGFPVGSILEKRGNRVQTRTP